MAQASTLTNPIKEKLYLAMELSEKGWQLGFTNGVGQAPRLRSIGARDVEALSQEIEQASKRFGQSGAVEVYSCYEAGRDGFWLHRYLEQHGVANVVVDSASIEVNRRARRAKSDRLDVRKLLDMLIRYQNGERKVWHVVNVPSSEEEDQRHLHRELGALKVERTRHTNRIKGWLAGQGIRLEVDAGLPDHLASARRWDGTPLEEGLRQRILREYQRIRLINQQIHEIEVQRLETLRTSQAACVQQVRQLMRLKGIGIHSAWLYVMEFFAWRKLRNRRQVGALAGLTPTPFQSGSYSHEQGISKAGNRQVRGIAIEIAWGWLYHQPESKLSHWYQERFAQGGSRMRRIGIVALARRLLVDLWRYLETGTVPEGAELKA